MRYDTARANLDRRAAHAVATYLAALPHAVVDFVHVDANGEVWWQSPDAERAVNALAEAGT